jgi:uncharacterized membrane protein (DUF2068 family)
MGAAGAGTRAGLRVVAAFEGLKGALVLGAGCGALARVHRDLQAVAENVVSHFHLNPGSRVPRIFLEAAARTTDARLWALAAFAAAYAAVRLAEAYGLWRGLRWAEWLGAASGGLYVPVEVYEIARRVTVTRAVLLTGNLLVVIYLVRVLYVGRGLHEPPPASAASEGGFTPPQRAGGLGGATTAPPRTDHTSSSPGKK